MAKQTAKRGYPRFCFITPTAYLERYASQSEMHLVLAHLVDTDEEYANFYAKNDYYKIMDNGAFELGESYAPEKLVELGRKCNANAVVLPDYPFQPAQVTIDASSAVLDEIKDAGFETMFVPQSETGDLKDWINGYVWAATNPSIDIIGMSILGMPNAIPHVDISYARVVLTQILIERGVFNFDKYHHYLGLNAGPALEIPTLIKMGALDSCDSSNPVWMAICGHRYNPFSDSFLQVGKVKKEVEFDYPMVKDPAVLSNIQYNIDLTQDMIERCRGRRDESTIEQIQREKLIGVVDA
jgi:hypothetical protein